jgi:hypothetical protein
MIFSILSMAGFASESYTSIRIFIRDPNSGMYLIIAQPTETGSRSTRPLPLYHKMLYNPLYSYEGNH